MNEKNKSLTLVKNFLRNAENAKQRMEADKALYEMARAYAEGVPSFDFKSIKVHGGGKAQKLEADAVKLVTLEEKLIKSVGRWSKCVQVVREVINHVNDARFRAVLERRYLRGQAWAFIAREMNYSWAQTHRFHSAALVEVQKILNAKKDDME